MPQQRWVCDSCGAAFGTFAEADSCEFSHREMPKKLKWVVESTAVEYYTGTLPEYWHPQLPSHLVGKKVSSSGEVLYLFEEQGLPLEAQDDLFRYFSVDGREPLILRRGAIDGGLVFPRG